MPEQLLGHLRSIAITGAGGYETLFLFRFQLGQLFLEIIVAAQRVVICVPEHFQWPEQ